MQSPRVEWAVAIGHLALLDWIRDRGEPDSDTLSECLRELYRVETPAGRKALAVTVAAGGLLLYRHLVKPEMRPT